MHATPYSPANEMRETVKTEKLLFEGAERIGE